MAVIAAGLFGLLFGSFSSVLIGRWYVKARPWSAGRSHCTSCDAAIAWYDNIPVLSWLWLGGKCRQCRARISVMYPALELAMGAGWAAVVAVLGLTWLAVALMVLWFFTVVLSGIDIRHHRLPTPMIGLLAAAWIALALGPAALAGEWETLARAGIGAAALGGFYGLMWVIKPAAMGFGDVRLATVLGGVLGTMGWQSLAVGAIAGPLLGGLVAVPSIVRAGRVSGVALPYGPVLLAGAWVGIALGDVIGPWYLSLFMAG